MRRQRTAKPEQHGTLARIGSKRWPACKGSYRCLRHQSRHGGEHRLHSSDATTQPTQRAGQRNLEAAELVRGRRHASGRLRCSGGCLNRGQQARQSGGEEVRQQAECSMALRAVPASNAQAPWRHARIAAMAGERAPAGRMHRARDQAGITPFVASDVRLGTRLSAQWDLQGRSPTRR